MSRELFKTIMGKICYSKRQCFPFYEPSCYSWWTSGNSAVGSFVEHKYMYFTVENSRVQSISQALHFSMSYDGFGSGMKTCSPDSCNSLRDFGNLWSFIWML